MEPKRVYTDIEINATPQEVWDVLMAFDKFHEWNPLFKFIEGDVRIGGGLTEHIYLFGPQIVRWTSKVIALNPPYEFAWRGHVWFETFGLGEHHYEIVPVTDNKVKFVHWELFYGAVPNTLGWLLKLVAEKKFRKMNEAIKQRVERLKG